MSVLESRSLQSESGRLIDAEHNVHILYSLSYCSLKQIVNAGCDQQLVVDDVGMDKRLVGIDYLLQIST